jgi:hypothetical protein
MANVPSVPASRTLFEQHLTNFKSSLTPKEQNEFGETTYKGLRETIAAIQKKQASTRTTQNMTRLQGFLEAMEQYGKVAEAFVNANEFFCFIWVCSC